MIADWHWLVLGLVLIALEALGAGGFLIGAAIAAFILSLMTYMDGFAWEWQIIIFAGLSLVFTGIVWRFFKKSTDNSEAEMINNRASQLIGRVEKANQEVFAGQGKIQIGDTLWKVKTEENIQEGDVIEVYGAEGMTLLIRVKH
jgi:membrane protein implicated in regulation of membrane protease activity